MPATIPTPIIELENFHKIIMTSKFFALTLTLLLFVSQPLFLLAQDVPKQQQDWTAIQALAAGTKLEIETKAGKRLKGKLNTASDTTIALFHNNTTVNLNRDEIQRIYRLSGGSRATSTAIGVAVGAGAGAGISAAALGATSGSDNTTGILATGILIGTGIGAALGAALGKGSRRVLIYESK